NLGVVTSSYRQWCHVHGRRCASREKQAWGLGDKKRVRAQPDRLSQKNSDFLLLHGYQLALHVLHKNGCNSPDMPVVGEDGAEPGFVRAILIEQADKTPGLAIRLDMQFGKQRTAYT